ncbi:MAG: class I SAM-dependent methyltransferase [Clostridia bacterium]|nr:class I SAM-dependent methyltransferase [Clostridia bacterium]
MGSSYSVLGKYFEYLNDDCDYRVWAQYLISRVRSLGDFRTGLDMGCGNGYFTRALEKAGYAMTGVDISPEMLSVASQKSLEEGCRAEYLMGDIATFSAKNKAGFVVAVNDVVNYVPPEKLKAAFRHVYASLERGGAFLFDISSEHKLRDVLAGQTFCDVRDDVSYIWFNEMDGDRLDMDLTFFVRRGDGSYEREDESQTQYVYTEDGITKVLEEAGFTDITSEGHLGKDKAERINFTGRKT